MLIFHDKGSPNIPIFPVSPSALAKKHKCILKCCYNGQCMHTLRDWSTALSVKRCSSPNRTGEDKNPKQTKPPKPKKAKKPQNQNRQRQQKHKQKYF